MTHETRPSAAEVFERRAKAIVLTPECVAQIRAAVVGVFIEEHPRPWEIIALCDEIERLRASLLSARACFNDIDQSTIHSVARDIATEGIQHCDAGLLRGGK